MLKTSHQSIKRHRTETKCLAKVVLTPGFECGEDMVKIRGAAGELVSGILISVFIHPVNLLPDEPPQIGWALDRVVV
jgi:hypothetical protein